MAKKELIVSKDNQVVVCQQSEAFFLEIRRIIEEARNNAVRSVDYCRVQMYWNIGRRIVEEEQQGKDRAEYGAYIIKNLANNLEPEYGSGFSKRQLELSRQFYRTYPIANTLYSQLNWSQYKLLIAILNEYKREYYDLVVVNNMVAFATFLTIFATIMVKYF